jgi:hypothetical protein
MRIEDGLRIGVAGVCAAVLLALPPVAAAAETASQQFTDTGEHQFVVPPGVFTLQAKLIGGAGSPGLGGGQPGGSGASVTATLAVAPGETLFAEVGGYFEVTKVGPGFVATNGGGAGGGGFAGAGGGASDLRTCSSDPGDPFDPIGCATQDTLGTRLVVAGGGGGGGGDSYSAPIIGGAGGNAGEAGGGGDENPAYEVLGGTGGQPASQTKGGEAGLHSNPNGVAAAAGQLGAGGNGGGEEEGTYSSAGGGGGGGGIYGGGGGGSGESTIGGDQRAGGGGGGGGSTGVPSGVVSVSNLVISTAEHKAVPEVGLTWTLPAPAVVASAVSDLSPTSATLNGSVDPNGSQVQDCHFQLAPAPPSGGSVPCVQQIGSGGLLVPISAAAAGLQSGTVYTVTLTASNTQGAASASPVSFTTPTPTRYEPPVGTSTALSITALTLSPTTFRRGKHMATVAKAKRKAIPSATTISFSLSETAAVTLTFEELLSGVTVGHSCVVPSKTHRKAHRCKRYATLRNHVTRSAHTGLDKIHFEGILDGNKPLSGGTYRVSLKASTKAGSATATQHPTFKLLP